MLDETIREETSSEELGTSYILQSLYLQHFPPPKFCRDSTLQYQTCNYVAARAEKVFAYMLEFCCNDWSLSVTSSLLCYKKKKNLGNFILKHAYDPQLHRIFFYHKSPIKRFKGSIQ